MVSTTALYKINKEELLYVESLLDSYLEGFSQGFSQELAIIDSCYNSDILQKELLESFKGSFTYDEESKIAIFYLESSHKFINQEMIEKLIKANNKIFGRYGVLL